MKFLIGIPIVFLLVSGLVLLVVASYLYRFWMRITKHIRGEFSDEEIERLSKKYQKQTQSYNFDKDYFKRRDGGSYTTGERTSGQKRQTTTQTSSGVSVTIIDDREPNVARRKIFNKDEGEYVDFKEEN